MEDKTKSDTLASKKADEVVQKENVISQKDTQLQQKDNELNDQKKREDEGKKSVKEVWKQGQGLQAEMVDNLSSAGLDKASVQRLFDDQNKRMVTSFGDSMAHDEDGDSQSKTSTVYSNKK